MAFYKDLKKPYRYPTGRDKPGQAGWVSDRLLRLRAMLNGDIQSRRDPKSLIIGSWNIRHFDGGRLRLPESYHYIAEIIDHFDICAVQEVKDIDAVKRLMTLLGPSWDYFVNDSSGSGRGNHERMAFLYNKTKVRFRNLIGELGVAQDALPNNEQLARPPFFASFQAGWFRFTLCSAHIVFGEDAGRPLREDEIRVVSDILAKRAKQNDEVHIFLGDMNIDDKNHAGYQVLIENGFDVPDIGPTSMGGDKYYDQIAFTGPSDVSHQLNSGVIKWQEAVFTDEEIEDYKEIAQAIRRDRKSSESFWDFHSAIRRALEAGETIGKPYKNWAKEYSGWRTHEMSDHLPIWIELKTDYSNAYLRGIN